MNEYPNRVVEAVDACPTTNFSIILIPFESTEKAIG
jgi:hypothetical protein